MLIKEQTIQTIRDVYRKRFNAIIFKISGPEALKQEELDELILSGLIHPEDHSFITDAYHIARLRNGKDFRERPKMTLDEFRQKAEREVLQLTPREKYALSHIKASAGNYITKLRDKTLADVEGAIRAHNYDERNKIIDDVIRPTIGEGIQSKNATIREIASRLRERTGDTYRDWKRVAVTEISNALNLGAADAIIDRNKDKKPSDILVYKLVHLDSALCPHCRRFYLESDGITPKVYKMSELMANGSNYGKKPSQWRPTLGATHPNERCELVELPRGFGFESGSNRATFIDKDFKWRKN